MRAYTREILTFIIVAIVAFFLSYTTVVGCTIEGTSMEPSFEDGQYILVNKVVYRFHEPQRGDVIVFHSSTDQDIIFIKRIIAVPGDTVEIKGETVYVNNSAIYEPYIMAGPLYTMPQQEIPVNEYFVLGDNRNISYDSHNGWAIKRQDIIGKAWLSILPLELVYAPSASMAQLGN